MKRLITGFLGLVIACMTASQAEAYTSRDREAVSVPVTAVGVTETAVLDPVAVVVEGSADTAATSISFGDVGPVPADLVDSGEALKISVNTNVAGNRLIISTDNLRTGVGAADPRFCDDTAKGNDGGGLVGIPTAGLPDNCKFTVPLVWAVRDANDNYGFVKHVSPPPAIGADNGVFMTDRAHVRTFTARNGTLDNVGTKFCDAAATHGVPETNTADDGLYPQYFGEGGENLDICRTSDSTKILEAEELSKNIAVIALGLAGSSGTAPDVTTASATDTISVSSPFYVPLAADFRGAS